VTVVDRPDLQRAVWRVWRTTRDTSKVSPEKKTYTANKTKLLRRKMKLQGRLTDTILVTGGCRLSWNTCVEYVIHHLQAVCDQCGSLKTIGDANAGGVLTADCYSQWIEVGNHKCHCCCQLADTIKRVFITPPPILHTYTPHSPADRCSRRRTRQTS
jgi:hypothetical protein